MNLLLKTTFIIAISFNFLAYSQAPEMFKYQAVVRNSNGGIVSNQLVSLQLEILQGGTTGMPVYTETFELISNGYGLVNLGIGTGLTMDDFSMIDWANGTYFMRTSIDLTGGTTYTVMGTSQFLSVPYALHSETAQYVNNDAVDDADNDPTNEIQDISLLENSLSLSNGSTIDLSTISTQINEEVVDSMVANNGYLTSIPSSVNSILIMPSMISPTTFGGGVIHNVSNGDAAITIDFPDGITGIAKMTLPTPSDWDGSPMSLKILYSSDGVSGDFYFVTSVTGASVGQSTNQQPNSVGLVLPSPLAQDTFSEITTVLNLAGQTSIPDILNIAFRRFGTSAQDVSADTLHVLGFVLDYNTL